MSALTEWRLEVFSPYTEELLLSITLLPGQVAALQTILPPGEGHHLIEAFVGKRSTECPDESEEHAT